MTEEWARTILMLAIKNGQAKEFIETLWDGGSFIVDPEPGSIHLVFLTKEQLEVAARGLSRD